MGEKADDLSGDRCFNRELYKMIVRGSGEALCLEVELLRTPSQSKWHFYRWRGEEAGGW